MARYIGIDLGTSTTLVFIRGKGVVLEEPSAVAVSKTTGELLEVGTEAAYLAGKTPPDVEVIRPMSEGVISKYEYTLEMLRYFLRSAMPKRQIFKPYVAVCVPGSVTDVEERAVRDALTQLGAKYTYLIEEPLAAAIGAGLDTDEADAKMIIDIGGGTCDVAVISYGKIAVSESIRVAGDKFDEAIIRYVRRKHNLLIGERTAERVKCEIGSVWQREEPLTLEVSGKSLVEGLPRAVRLSSAETVTALEEPVTLIIEAVCSVIEKTPPEMLRDIHKSGLVMTGGGSKLYGLDKLISNVVGIKTRVAENAQTAVAIGTETALERFVRDPDKYPEFSRSKRKKDHI